MRDLRNFISVAVGSLLSLSAAAAHASIYVGGIQAMNGVYVSSSELANPGDTLTVRVEAGASDGVYLVEAELGGVTIELARGSTEYEFEGTFDLSGFAYGPHHLTVRVYDLLGDVATAERTVLR